MGVFNNFHDAGHADCIVCMDGKPLPVSDAQKKQIHAVVAENIDPRCMLDVMWSEGQIAEMGKDGWFLTGTLPDKGNGVGQRAMQYCVIANGQHRYLMLTTDHGIETFGFPKDMEVQISEIVPYGQNDYA